MSIIDVYSTRSQTKLFVSVRLILLLGEIILVFFMLRKQVAQPLAQLSHTTRQLTQGDLIEFKDEKLINRQDEIGEIGRATYTLTNYFKEVIKDIVRISQGLAEGNLRIKPETDSQL